MTVRMVDRTGKTILGTMPVLDLPKGDYDVVILYDPINASDIMLSGEGTTSRPSPTTSEIQLKGARAAILHEAFNLCGIASSSI